ncbi:hypothetical protein [Streptomyces eurythermus]|uniref:hypothetical protein n=1 Tax=Streptomyces eurythermus TaxID=42237 RepID=UPI0036D2C511
MNEATASTLSRGNRWMNVPDALDACTDLSKSKYRRLVGGTIRIGRNIPWQMPWRADSGGAVCVIVRSASADAEAGLRAEYGHYAAGPARTAGRGLPCAVDVVAVHVPGGLFSAAWSGAARLPPPRRTLRLLTEDHNARRTCDGGDRTLITACLGEVRSDADEAAAEAETLAELTTADAEDASADGSSPLISAEG